MIPVHTLPHCQMFAVCALKWNSLGPTSMDLLLLMIHLSGAAKKTIW